jgi:outer membrane lipoprotein-sorting protein
MKMRKNKKLERRSDWIRLISALKPSSLGKSCTIARTRPCQASARVLLLLLLGCFLSSLSNNSQAHAQTSGAKPLATQAVRPAPVAALIDPQEALLAQVQAHLRATTSMRARFSQTGANGNVASGSVLFARPGGIRFDYQGNVPYLVVSDGKTLNLVDYEIKQVQSYPVQETPLAVLLDPKLDLRTRARVVQAPDNAPDKAGGKAGDKAGLQDSILIEARDSKHPEYGVITLGFVRDSNAPAGLKLVGWHVLDAQGTSTRIQLFDQRYNVAIEKSAFRFKDPRPARSGVPGRP